MHVAVVGCGYWGPNLIRNLQSLEGVEVSVCDKDKRILDSVCSKFMVASTTCSFTEVLSNKNIDAVVIATPANTHYQLSKKALAAGKHVLVEKPIALSSRDAKKLIDLAKKEKKVLMVGHTFEYNPAVIKLRDYLRKGELGKVYYACSQRLNLGRIREDINVTWNLAPHDISILIYIFGAMPLSVKATGKSFLQKGIEDVVFMDLEFPKNIIAHVHVSWLDPSKIRQMTVVGDKKMIIYNDVDNEGKLKIYDKGFSKMTQQGTYGEFFYKLRSGDIHIPKIELTEPLKAECEHFIDCIKKKKKPKTDGENGLRVLKVLEAAQKSLRSGGRPVKIS